MTGSILLSAGGTGGHLFPAEALAHELKQRGWIIYLATDDRAERYADRFPADEVFIIPSATFASKNPFSLLKTFWTIWKGVREAGRVIGRTKPKAVAGFGGYPTLPPVYAATRRNVPTIIHEQNAVMGRANKALAPRVDAIAGGFLAAGGPYAGKTVATGNPVRPDVVSVSALPYSPSGSGEVFSLLVFGGSQGARFFGDAMPGAIARLSAQQKARLRVVQQARPEDADTVSNAYRKLGIAAEISPFFDDMAVRMSNAHLIFSRSGASTVSEIAAIGRPAVLVPYPHALDHDQSANAAALAAAGGAEIQQQHTLDAETIANIIGKAMDEPDRLGTMAEAARSAGRPDAVLLLADLVEAIASNQSVGSIESGTRP